MSGLDVGTDQSAVNESMELPDLINSISVLNADPSSGFREIEN